ncbi:MAG: hypothetical protein Q7N87_00920 [Candidatus Uhrbacteria bacterium]|nr:hypothetical protein [Candidatus Uhrbacteria bacterium]
MSEKSYEEYEAERRKYQQMIVHDVVEFEQSLQLLSMDKQRQRIDSVMNNFYCKVPGGLMRTRISLDILRMRDSESRDDKPKRKDSSELRDSQTGLDFFAAIDKVLLECDLTIEEVEHDNKLAGERADDRAILHQKLFPVYKKLREKGYTHQDIVS